MGPVKAKVKVEGWLTISLLKPYLSSLESLTCFGRAKNIAGVHCIQEKNSNRKWNNVKIP